MFLWLIIIFLFIIIGIITIALSFIDCEITFELNGRKRTFIKKNKWFD